MDDSDDFLSGALIVVECGIFLVAFLILSEVYVTDNYDKGAMMNAVLALIIVALCCFVPFNIVSKVPSLDSKLNRLREIFDVKMMEYGINVPNFAKLDARTRYVS
jgi:hypothetical protein